MPRLIGRRFWFALLLIGVLTVSACGKKGVPAPQGGADIAPSKINLKRNVELVRVEQRKLTSTFDAVGQLEPEAITKIAAGVSGIVDDVLIREGDWVDPGLRKPLIRVDQKRFAAALSVAQSQLREAEANANAARDAAQRALEGGAAVSTETRRNALEAKAAAEARLESVRATLSLAKLNSERSVVMPPCQGQINQRNVAVGDYVKEDTVIAVIADLSRIRVSAYVPESVEPMIRRHMDDRARDSAVRALMVGLASNDSLSAMLNRTAVIMGEVPAGFDPEFTVQPFPRRLFRAAVFFMSKVADPTTHMFEVKGELHPMTPGIERLSPGFTARLRFPLQTSNDAMVVPEEALRATERGFIAFVPEKRPGRDGGVDWVARPRRVEVGTRSPGWVEIRHGLAPGEWVVRRGAEALEDGTPIRIPDKQIPLLER